MAFFVYIAIVLVSIAGILLELDWLTKPKSDTRSPVQVATRTVALPPQANAKAKNQSADLAAAYPKNPDTPQIVSPKQPDTLRSDQTIHDADAKPPAGHAATGEAQVKPQPAPAQKVNAQPAPQADGSTAGSALAYAAETPPAPAAAAVVSPAQTAAAAPVAAPAAAVAPPPAPTHTAAAPTHAAAAAPNRCDVQGCASAYQSFRASDCTYQPFEGPRRTCEKPPATTGRAVASQPRTEPRGEASYRKRNEAAYRERDDDVDRDVVVRRARPIDTDDDDADVEDDRGTARSRVIVIERPARERW